MQFQYSSSMITRTMKQPDIPQTVLLLNVKLLHYLRSLRYFIFFTYSFYRLFFLVINLSDIKKKRYTA